MQVSCITEQTIVLFVTSPSLLLIVKTTSEKLQYALGQETILAHSAQEKSTDSLPSELRRPDHLPLFLDTRTTLLICTALKGRN